MQWRRSADVRLSIDKLETLEAIEGLAAEWHRLWERDPAATPFEGPDWLVPWTRHLWGGGRLRVLAVRQGRELAAVAPLFLWGYDGDPLVVRVSLLGSGISDYLGITAAPELAVDAARRIYEWLAETDDDWHVCDLQELRPGCALLHCERPVELAAREVPGSICPVLALPPDFGKLESGLDSKFCRNLRNAGHRLARAGNPEIVAAPADANELMHALFRLHRSRWEERGQAGVLAAEAVERFHLEAADRLVRSGALRLMGLRLNGEIIAVQYSLFGKGCYFCYLSGFDPAYAACSPGALLIAETIRRAIAEGCREVDFLRQREPFKYQWGARDRSSRRLVVTRSASRERSAA